MQTVSDVIGEGGGKSFDGDWVNLQEIEGKQVTLLGFVGPIPDNDPTYPDKYIVGLEIDDVPTKTSTNSKPLQNRLDALEEAGAWPVLGTFSKLKSSKNPGKSYWSLT